MMKKGQVVLSSGQVIHIKEGVPLTRSVADWNRDSLSPHKAMELESKNRKKRLIRNLESRIARLKARGGGSPSKLLGLERKLKKLKGE